MPAHEGGDEVRLGGGLVTDVVRVGDTVRRETGPWSPAVHALLKHLESVGYSAAPRLLGIDPRGREILTYVDGVVPQDADPYVVTDLALEDTGRLIRKLHEAADGFVLPDGVGWYFSPLGGPGPWVVCHHDLAPRNTVFRDGRVVAFIDWDLATLDAPIHDLRHAAWEFVPLASDETCRQQGWSQLPDRGRRLRILLDAYGLPVSERANFAAGVAERMETSARGIEAMAARGMPEFRRLVERGIPGDIRRDVAWVLAHAAGLDPAIQR